MKIMINWYVTRIVELAKELHQTAPVALTVATSSIFIQEVVILNVSKDITITVI